MMLAMAGHRCIRNASRFSLSAGAVLLAFFALAGAKPVHAGSDEVPPGRQEYRQVGQQALQSTMPESLLGMPRERTIFNTFTSAAVYSGGKPLESLGLVVGWSPGAEEYKAKIQEGVREGAAVSVERNGRTMYLTGSAVASTQSGAPAAVVAVGDKLVAVRGMPGGDASADTAAVRAQLLQALESVDVERLAGISPASAMLCSAQIEISGGVDATLQVSEGSVGFLGGFTDTRWSIGLLDKAKGMEVRLFYLPTDIGPGTYELHEQPSLGSGKHGTVISAKVMADDFLPDGDNAYWAEDVTGTLTVESVDNGRMTGQFEFTALSDDLPPVEVKGAFEGLVILDGEQPSPPAQGDAQAPGPDCAPAAADRTAAAKDRG